MRASGFAAAAPLGYGPGGPARAVVTGGSRIVGNRGNHCHPMTVERRSPAPSSRRARMAARATFAAEDHPVAVFLATDHIALAVTDALRFEFDLTAPGAVAGCDDASVAAWPGRDRATSRERREAMVQRSGGLRAGRIEGEQDGRHAIRLPGRAPARGTTGRGA